MGTMQEHQATAASERGMVEINGREYHNEPENKTSPMDVDDRAALKTPTHDNFASEAVLPPSQVSPTNPADTNSPSNPKKLVRSRANSIARADSLRSNHSVDSGDVDVDMDDEDEDSDNESATSDTGRPSKKKKGQRFFCTEFPPCQLSFTRSEHLARHIRKHTGERPFQCHCLRRFSRLDNLRQHAQTVHVNEEIPGDSLAATGTRFQRQIRTERMRTPGNRARAVTISSGTGVHNRGHSRNYSTSSIGSISDLGSPDDGRRRPQPLAMAQTPIRGGLTVDPYAANAAAHEASYSYYNQSPSEYSTSTSIFSGGPSSPSSMAPHLQSPIGMTPRTLSWGDRVPNRRLSVPSGTSMFQTSTPYNPRFSYMSPVASSNASTYSNSGSIVQSPTSSIFSDSRRDSVASEAEIRRRTWHPGTYAYTARPATSGLTYHQTPDAPQPTVATQPAAAQNVRLPGIDSFDLVTGRSDAPPRRAPSPMEIDSPSRRLSIPRAPASVSLARLSDQREFQNRRQDELTNPPSEQFGNGGGILFQRQFPAPAPQPAPQVSRNHLPQPLIISKQTATDQGAEASITPRQKKRQGWYNGPLPGPVEAPILRPPRTSPEGSSSSEGLPTPSTASAIEYHPTIICGNGEIEAGHSVFHLEDNQKTTGVAQHPPQVHPNAPFGRSSNDMERLDALVAVATSENRVAER